MSVLGGAYLHSNGGVTELPPAGLSLFLDGSRASADMTFVHVAGPLSSRYATSAAVTPLVALVAGSTVYLEVSPVTWRACDLPGTRRSAPGVLQVRRQETRSRVPRSYQEFVERPRNPKGPRISGGLLLVGDTGFEPVTSSV